MIFRHDKCVATFEISDFKVALHNMTFQDEDDGSLHHSYHFNIMSLNDDMDTVTILDDNTLVSSQDTMYSTDFSNVLRSILTLYKEMESEENE